MSISTLDDTFSQFIRLRDSDEHGYCRCISCGTPFFWKYGDCGHYVDRDHMSTRYHEKNCNGQCVSCNRYGDGNKDGYENGLVKKYGPGILQELTLAKHQIKKFSKSDIIELEKDYKEKIKELKKLKIAA